MDDDSRCESARSYFRATIEQLSHIDLDRVDEYADLLLSTWVEDRSVFLFGNGGSACTASHHAIDCVKAASAAPRRLKAFSLPDSAGLTTAISNDIAFEDAFVFPLESYARPGDVAVAISCSGTSPNVVRAAEWARENELTVVALTGFDGGRLATLGHLNLHVPSNNYGVVEDIHLAIGHAAAQRLRVHVEALIHDRVSENSWPVS